MEYHEIGEKFEYYGVILEVAEARYCKDCFFLGKLGRCILESPMYCGSNTRVDNKRISYKRVEQCKTKDMEKKTEFERIQEERDKIIQKTDFIIEGTGKGMLRKYFWKEKTLWSDGYFVCSIGEANPNTVIEYFFRNPG